MKVDVNSHVSKCVKCAHHKDTLPKPAPILQYPPPEGPWDVVAMDLLQLPASHQGSRYLLVCVDHFSRFVVLAPLQNKAAETVAHSLITNLFCPYSTPRVLLNDNGEEFRNAVLVEFADSSISNKLSQLHTILLAMGWLSARMRKFLKCYALL